MLHLDSLNGVKFAIRFEHRYTQQLELTASVPTIHAMR